MRDWDCSIDGSILENVEVRAPSQEEAKRQFLSAILRALTVDAVEAHELELV